MSPVQRVAVFMLGVSVTTIVAYVALFLWQGPSVAPAAMAVMALTAAVPFIHDDKQKDERERLLAARGLQFGMTASYLFVIIICMGTWFSHYRAEETMVDVSILPVICTGAWVVGTLVHSATVLIVSRQPMEVGA